MQKPNRPARWTPSLGVLVAAALLGTGCRPPGPAALLKGDALLKAGKVDAAVAQFEKAIRYHDLETNAQAWNHLGLAYHRQGQSRKAEQAYQKALLLDRNLAAARLNLGYLYLETGNNLAAADAFTTYCTLKADLPEAWLRLGQAQVRAAAQLPANERGRLLEAARSNLEYAPPGAEKLNLLGQVSFLRGRPREAAPLFSAAVQADPTYPPAVLNLAVVYQQLGDRRSALAGYRGYLAMAPHAEDSAAIQATVAALDAELNPAPIVVAAPTIVPPPAVTNPVVRTVQLPTNPPPQATVAVARPEPAPAKTNAFRAPVIETAAAPAPKATLPTRTEVATVPVTKVEEAPAIRPSVKEPVKSVAPPEVVVSPTNARPDYNLAGLTNVPSGNASAKTEKKGFFARMNPVGWFGNDGEKPRPKPQPKPQGTPVLSAATQRTSEPARTEVEPQPAPQYPRYPYRVSTAPRPGDRAKAQSHFDSGLEAHRIQRESAAVGDYEKAVALDPAFYEAHFNLSLCYQTLRQIPDALREAEYAVALQPKADDARYQLAQLLDIAGYPEDAVAQAREAVAIKESDARAHLLLGTIYAQKLMNAPQARVHYQRFLELEPKNPAATAVRYWLATTQ
jgi:tetratricopeptide (TPR) repeat protein